MKFKLASAESFKVENSSGYEIATPTVSSNDTFALVSNLSPVKQVQKNGVALTPDSNGAVNIKGVYYATCDTAKAATVKVATIKNLNEVFVLEEGVVVYVRFTNASPTNTSGSSTGICKLNVANTGEKKIYGPTSASLGSGVTYTWNSNAIIGFIYDAVSDCWRALSPSLALNLNYAGVVGIQDQLTTPSVDLTNRRGVATAAILTNNIGLSIAPLWVKNASTSYSTGDFVMYTDGKLYKAKQDIAANTAWNASYWQATTIDVEKADKTHTHTANQITDLGDAATKNVGTASGTVAAGDHTHDTLYSSDTNTTLKVENDGTATLSRYIGEPNTLDQLLDAFDSQLYPQPSAFPVYITIHAEHKNDPTTKFSGVVQLIDYNQANITSGSFPNIVYAGPDIDDTYVIAFGNNAFAITYKYDFSQLKFASLDFNGTVHWGNGDATLATIQNILGLPDTATIEDVVNKINFSKKLSTADHTHSSLSNGTYTASLPTLNSNATLALSSQIPTVNDATLTIQKNGTTIDTFTANASSNKTVNITVPTVNDATLTIQKNGTTIDTFTANASSNKTVNITVPTVNDATLTIQKNGTPIDTFTANASSNKTINISVPTKLTDLTNDLKALKDSTGSYTLSTPSATAAGTIALTSDTRYAIVTPTQTPSGTSVSLTLADRAVNQVVLESSVTTATISFPTQIQGYARDFFVRLTITGSTVPAITWQESNGDAINFDVDDDSWTEIEQGVNLLMFTETAQ